MTRASEVLKKISESGDTLDSINNQIKELDKKRKEIASTYEYSDMTPSDDKIYKDGIKKVDDELDELIMKRKKFK